MSRIGIASMQRINNYGSFLQAYALKKIIETLGVQNTVEFVDFHPGEVLIINDTSKNTTVSFVLQKLTALFEYTSNGISPFKLMAQKKAFNEFKKYYSFLGISSYNYNAPVDVLVIGSDEVFNCLQSSPIIGYAKELFGHNSKAKKCISYAASFGNTTLIKLQQYGIKDEVADMLQNNFSAISVRDNNSKNIVDSLTKDVYSTVHLDPVLTYGYTELLAKAIKPTNEKYLILYGYTRRFTRQECREIRKFAKSKGLKVYCVFALQFTCDRFISADPFEMLSYFKYAEYVISDTFHGTIFSIINRVPFVSIIRNDKQVGHGNSEKLGDLLERLHLNDRRLDECNAEKLNMILDNNIDYDSTYNIIEFYRKSAYGYLRKILSEEVK